jgi:hypothetical protein
MRFSIQELNLGGKMGRQSLLSLVWIVLLVVGGCATGQLTGDSVDAVGMQETELIAAKGRPQQIIPTPAGGKIFIYENRRMDQVAIMGGGTWDKPEQTYYWLNAQGQVEKTKYYPYGKRKFLFNPEQESIQVAAAPPPARPQASPSPPEAETKKPLQAASSGPVAPLSQGTRPAAPQTTEPVVSRAPAPTPAYKGMKEAAGLELGMRKTEVNRLLGVPERTEGFLNEGKQVVIWTYRLGDPGGHQVLTPLVFENGRLSGWGDTYYRATLKKVGNQPR